MTLKDDRKLKDMATMTTGVTATQLKDGALINLHGHSATITSTDAEDTTVQYANRARRTFGTHDLNSFLELGTFPVTTELERRLTDGFETAYINAVTGDCCYRVRIVHINEHLNVGAPRYQTFTYAEFIAWHMENPAPKNRPTPPSHYPPTLEEIQADDKREAQQATKVDESDEDTTPLEEVLITHVEELQAENARLQADLAVAEINGQSRINVLTQENFALKAEINQSINLHNTRLLAAAAEIESLQTKAAILHPEPTGKEVYTLVQTLNFPERRQEADRELAAKLSEGWGVLHIEVTTIFYPQEAVDGHTRIVTLVRDLSADQPKARAAIEYRLDIGIVPPIRPPVQQPPMPLPVNQTVIMAGQPVSRTLTHNVPRILTPAQLQEQKQRFDGEIEEIFNRGAVRQEALRRHYANQPNAFPQGG